MMDPKQENYFLNILKIIKNNEKIIFVSKNILEKKYLTNFQKLIKACGGWKNAQKKFCLLDVDESGHAFLEKALAIIKKNEQSKLTKKIIETNYASIYKKLIIACGNWTNAQKIFGIKIEKEQKRKLSKKIPARIILPNDDIDSTEETDDEESDIDDSNSDNDLNIDALNIVDETEEDTHEDAVAIESGFDDITKKYLQEIRQAPLLSADEEIFLATIIQTGNGNAEKARKKMTESNLRLVVRMASKYHWSGIQFLDLVSEGNIGLMKAVNKFLPEKQCRFSTYAIWWIRQAIERHIVNCKENIRLPSHIADDIRTYKKYQTLLFQELNRIPTDTDIAQKMIEKKEINFIKNATGKNDTTDVVKKLEEYFRRLKISKKSEGNVSLDNPMWNSDDDADPYDFLSGNTETPTDEIFTENQKKQRDNLLHEALLRCNERERTILILRFGIQPIDICHLCLKFDLRLGCENGKDTIARPRTLEEVGKIFQVTRERIRQIEKRALKKINSGEKGKKILKELQDFLFYEGKDPFVETPLNNKFEESI